MRHCQICFHPEREAMESQLKVGHSYRAVARQFHVSKDALFRHKAHCAGQEMAGTATSSASLALQVPGGVPVPSHPFPDQEVDLRDLKKVRAAAWGSKEELVLQALSEEKVKELKGRDIGIVAGICSDKHRQWRDLDKADHTIVPLAIPVAIQQAIQVALKIQIQNAEPGKPEGKE
jgi:hypothetical protein